METEQTKPSHKDTFAKKVWITVGILALSVCLILILRVAFNILLMVLAATLISVFFHALGDAIERRTHIRHSLSIFISVAGTILIFILLLWFMGNTLLVQIASLSEDFPGLINKAEDGLRQTTIGMQILDRISLYNTSKLMGAIEGFFNTSFGVLGNIYIIVFLSIFFTISPTIYINGLIKLAPPQAKKDMKIVLERIWQVLKGWLKGAMIAMLLITILNVIGLTVLGIPMALTLALMAGMLNFIPNFGPLIAMIPAVLIGFTISINMALIIAAMYVLIQALESNVITPMIQKKMIDLPPALTILSQVIMGTFSGVLGILLATPLLAIVIILVDELYVKKQVILPD